METTIDSHSNFVPVSLHFQTLNLFAKVCELLGNEQCMSPVSHPQTDQKTEHANRTLEDMLLQFIKPAQNDWNVKLPCYEFAVNNAWNRATDSTMFFFNHSDHPEPL